ncbi:MAG: protein-glutamate O-methyltransferase CheR [Planctomycetota bacterium]
MTDSAADDFLRWALPKLGLRWSGYLRVRQRACKRIAKRLRELNITSLPGYREHLAAHPEEWRVLDGLCRIVVSRLYRDPPAWQRLRDETLPALAQRAEGSGRSHLDAWSVGCACGEEPWTLTVLWQRELAAQYPSIELRVLATDADPRVLRRASEAIYPASSFRSAPADWRTPGSQDAPFEAAAGGYRLRAAYRNRVAFACQDVRETMPAGPFDLILCRNMAFTYFEPGLQARIATELQARLRPAGSLVIGRHEQLPGSE